MGLPTDNYYTYEKLLKQVTSDATCSNENDGICYLSNECSTYDQLTEFMFKLQFSTAQDGYYVLVPLAAFA